ncbi:prolipoprotein diacylglyceryl transferase [Pseudoflavonifractor gallinarum]|uniref:prolipoprotein diacylglyceryl transferase n=1 Tax=Pseudoflavonifractor gallinarum TaxID=2779352 RepID=UPI0036F1ADE8
MSQIVTFPGLGLSFDLNPIPFSIFGWPIHWYGIIIAAGFLLAVAYCTRASKRFGIQEDDLLDMLFFAVPLGILGARLYYIIFYLDLFRTADGSLDFAKMVRIWDGGLAIYGGVIAAALTLLVFCRKRHIPFLAFADLGVFGLLIGQAVGRWGNFVNVEAYGGETTLPWRMGITEVVNGVEVYKEVHPTFLYESLWNLVGLVLLILIARNWRKFDGQMFYSYLAWYGVGRGMIEGLRTDSLYFFGTGIRVSQMLGFASALVGIALLVWNLKVRPHTPEELWVNRSAAVKAAGEGEHGGD